MIKQKLHHCMVVFKPYPYFEIRVQREAEALIKRGHSVDVICPKYNNDSSEDEHNMVNIYRVNMFWTTNNKLFVRFKQYLQFFFLVFWKLTLLHTNKRDYDTIQTHNLPDFLVFSTLIPKLFGARIILDIHDLMPEFFQTRVGSDEKKFLLKLVFLQERLSCRYADLVITVTEHWRQRLINRGVASDKIIVVMNLADKKHFQPIPFSIQKKQDRFCLFYHGSMPYQYGLDLVLKAIVKLRDQIPTIYFKLVGHGEACEKLKKMVLELQLENYVEFIKIQPIEKLQSLIETADLAVVPYLDDPFTDSLMPTKLMEYAVCGIPCIVSRTTAISTYFDDDMVEFFQPGDVNDLAGAILKLYKNPRKREELGLNIQRFNERYNWLKQSSDYVSNVEERCFRRDKL